MSGEGHGEAGDRSMLGLRLGLKEIAVGIELGNHPVARSRRNCACKVVSASSTAAS
jgi:hypothetical protein